MKKIPFGPDWPRREHFFHFIEDVRCVVNVTHRVDVTELVQAVRQSGRRFYAVCIALVTQLVNRRSEFRMTRDEQGEPCFFEQVSPSYVIFHRDTETFTALVTPWTGEFESFYNALVRDMERYKNDTRRQIPCGMTEGTFDISCLPWLDFDSFDMHIFGEGAYLPPIITWGRCVRRGGRVEMPVALELHHAAADGFHMARFFRELEEEGRALAKKL